MSDLLQRNTACRSDLSSRRHGDAYPVDHARLVRDRRRLVDASARAFTSGASASDPLLIHPRNRASRSRVLLVRRRGAHGQKNSAGNTGGRAIRDDDVFGARSAGRPVSAIWIAALGAVLVFHCGHLIYSGEQRRWLHSAHIVMVLGMLYMYASIAFGWDWFPARVLMFIYLATSTAIIYSMLVRVRQQRSISFLWILALIQQGAMIYMWAPMTYWTPWITYPLVGYFDWK